MRKKLSVYLTVFLVLSAIALLLFFKAHAPSANLNSLSDVDVAKINKVILKNDTFSVTLEKNNDLWKMTSPVVDYANRQLIERVLAVLKGASITSIISEKKEKQISYQVDDAHALSIKVFVESAPQPQLDILLGKEASSYSRSCLRFAGKDPIYLAEKLPSYIISRSSDAYRSLNVFQFSSVDIGTISIKNAKSSWEFYRSTPTWMNAKINSPIDPNWINSLLTKITVLQASQFVPEESLPSKISGEKPALEITVNAKNQTESVIIGPVYSEKNAPAHLKGNHLARVAGRNTPLLLQDFAVKELSDFLSSQSVAK